MTHLRSVYTDGSAKQCGAVAAMQIYANQWRYSLNKNTALAYDTIRIPPYGKRCYFNVRSKADMSQLNLPHGDNN